MTWFYDRPRHWPYTLAWGTLAWACTLMTWTIGMAIRVERDRANMYRGN